jgi:hypothetical protein
MTAATLTLIDFLLARIAEDEAAARQADDVCPAPWGHSEPMVSSRSGHLEDAVGTAVAITAPVFQAHILRHDPAHVLAECEAKRRIMEEFSGNWVDEGHEAAGEVALGHLAAVYADHPDFRDEWRP